MDGLLLLAPAATSLGYEGQGDFTMQSDGKLLRRPDKQVAPFIYAGACILRPELFANINEEAFSLNKIWDAALSRERFYGLRLDGRWLHVGTPSSIAQAEKALNEV
jgi:MurNAc alpha-1-phosphate uridylyltransferase